MSARSMRRAHERGIEREQKRSQRLRKLGLAGSAALGATVVFAPAAEAATFEVTTPNDDGPGSLRQAVEDANNTPGLDQINFPNGGVGEITLLTGEIEIEDPVSINGPGSGDQTVDGNGNERIFYLDDETVTDAIKIDPGEDVTIEGLTLQNGYDNGGGAIQSFDADLTLTDLVLQDNVASGANGGGALYHDGAGSVTITDSTLSGNDAGGGGGGAYIFDAETTITGSTFEGNYSGDSGGGLYTEGENTTISGSSFTGNHAHSYGGGIYFAGDSSTAFRLSIDTTNVSGNFANSDGGGIHTDEGAVS